jgi:hypothetical protein
MPFSPTDIADCTLWLKPTAGVTVDANNMAIRVANLADLRENKLKYSEDISQAATWPPTRTVVLSATEVREDSSASTSHYIKQTVPLNGGRTVRVSVSLKRGTGTRNARILLDLAADASATVSLADGSVGTNAGWLATPTTALVGDYYVFSGTVALAAGDTAADFYIQIADAALSTSYSGDGASSIHATKFQVADIEAPATYVATTTVPYGTHFYQSTAANRMSLSRSDNAENITLNSNVLSNTNGWARAAMAAPVKDAENYLGVANAAWTLAPTAATAAHGFNGSGMTTGNQLVMSIDLKYVNYRYVVLAHTDGRWAGVKIDLLNRVAADSNAATLSVEPLGNDWYRYHVTIATQYNGPRNSYPRLYMADAVQTVASGAFSVATDGTERILAGRYQIRSATAAPTYIDTADAFVHAGINGLPTLVGDGLGTLMTSIAPASSIISVGANTSFLVLSGITAAAATSIMYETNGVFYYTHRADSKFRASFWDGANKIIEAAWPTRTPRVWVQRHDTGKIYLTNNIDAPPAAVDAGNITTLAGTLTIGGVNTTTQIYNGRIMEIIIFNRALTDAEIQQVVGYLSNQWAMDGLSQSSMLTMGCGIT